MIRPRQVLGAVAIALVAAGCGTASGVNPQSINADASSVLQNDVLALSRAVAAHNWPDARAELDSLRADLNASRATGSVGSQRADAIAAVVNQIAASVPPVSDVTVQPTFSTPATHSPPPKPAPAPSHHKHGD
jgi:hypothetical protein